MILHSVSSSDRSSSQSIIRHQQSRSSSKTHRTERPFSSIGQISTHCNLIYHHTTHTFTHAHTPSSRPHVFFSIPFVVIPTVHSHRDTRTPSVTRPYLPPTTITTTTTTPTKTSITFFFFASLLLGPISRPLVHKLLVLRHPRYVGILIGVSLPCRLGQQMKSRKRL